MSKALNILYLEHEEIDKAKWDSCISNASNRLIYGYSFYLDHMARNWDALILEDYKAVMPLTWNKKYGIYYLYQPFLAAQLGLFGNDITKEMLEGFLKMIPAKFRYWDIYLNQENVFNIESFQLYQRKNYVLDLSRPYEKLYDGYSENIKRNINKAEQAGCIVKKDFDVEEIIKLALAQMRSYAKKSGTHVDCFRKLYHYLHEQQKAITYGVTSSNDQLLASCVFFIFDDRAYYILVGNDPIGKTVGASHAVINSFIKDHAEKKLLLDFEGSDIPGLALFYSSFGSVEEKYSAIKMNRLPFYLKWIKK